MDQSQFPRIDGRWLSLATDKNVHGSETEWAAGSKQLQESRSRLIRSVACPVAKIGYGCIFIVGHEWPIYQYPSCLIVSYMLPSAGSPAGLG